MRLTSLFRVPAARRAQRRRPFRLRVEPLEARTVPAGFSTFLGGSDADGGAKLTVDGAGNTYVIGHTWSSDFPATFGTFHGGGTDLYVAKLGPDGSLLWAGLYGGSGDDTNETNPVVDAAGNLYLSGLTYSTDFPTTPGAYQETPSGTGTPSFLMKVDGATGAILYSTFLSANGLVAATGLAVDPAGNAYVAGETGATDLPTTPGAFQPAFGGGTGDEPRDAFALKLDPTGSSLVYATYLGGDQDDYGGDIAVDAAGNAYVTGTTWDGFPTTAGAFDTTANGPYEAFVAKLDPAGGSLVYSTYLGGAGSDYGDCIAVDAAGDAYVAGWTSSTDFPVTAGAYDTTHNGPAGGGDAYVAKLDPTGSTLVYATYLGGNKSEGAYDLAVDRTGSVLLTGQTASPDFPTTPDALSTTLNGPSDAFVAKLDPTGSSLVYSTYLGGSNDEYPLGIATDRGGNAYVSGNTLSADFPTTPGAWQGTYGGGFRDAFITKLAIGSQIGPGVTIDQAPGEPDPASGSTITFAVAFDAPVTGFDGSDIDFTGSTVGGNLAAEVSGTGTTYTVHVTGMTGTGTVVASISAGAADGAGLPSQASTSTDNVVEFDGIAPTVTVTRAAGQAAVTNASPLTFLVTFSEPVGGFAAAAVALSGAAGAAVTAVDPGPVDNSYLVTVDVPGAQTGTVVASVPAGRVADAAGNPNSASTGDGTVSFDNVPPTVTINRGPGQDDPTSGAAIAFAVAFSEPVAGFDPSDISFAGSTAGGTLAAAVTQTGPTKYTVSVTGMTTRGAVVASIPAGAAMDTAGNASEASTGTDNSVDFLHAGVIGLSATTADTTEGSVVHLTVSRTGGSEGVVSVDVAAVAGTAGPADYAVVPGTLTWGEGDTADQVIDVTIADDHANEGREAFAVALTNPVGGSLLGTAATTVSIAPSNGRVIDAAAVRPNKPSAVFFDGPGTTGDGVTVTLGGKLGTATVYLTDPDGDGRGPIEWIDLAGTDPTRSTLTVAVRKPRGGTGDARTTLAEVSGTGLRSLAAPTTDLIGTGIRLAGWLGSLKVGNVGGGADIVIAGAPPAKPKNASVKIAAGVVGGGTDVTVPNSPLGSLTAISFGDGTITAPAVGSITIKGKARTKAAAAIPGNFGADVTVSGAGVAAGANAVGSIRVAGTVSGATIAVAGGVGSVKVGAFVDSSLLLGAGGIPAPGLKLGSFTASGLTDAIRAAFADSTIVADRIGLVNLKSVGTAHPDQAFGVVAGVSLGGLRVATPAFLFDARRPTPQGLNLDQDSDLEFVVRVG